MSLFTSNSNEFLPFSFNQSMRSLLPPFLVCLFFLALYYTLVIGGVVPSSDGINQRQVNHIKAERYIYSNLIPNIVLSGSSMTAELLEKYFDVTTVTNIALSGNSSKTGLELVTLQNKKPDIFLVELNYTIALETDLEIMDALKNPLLRIFKTYFPIFREEYQPVSVLVHYLKNSSGRNADSESSQITNQELRERLVAHIIEGSQETLSPDLKQRIIEESEVIKKQLAELQKKGVRVVLFNVPSEKRIANTPRRQQERLLIRSLFPSNSFEWLPEPITEDWITYDGVHLVSPDAKKFARFIQDQLIDSDQFNTGTM